MSHYHHVFISDFNEIKIQIRRLRLYFTVTQHKYPCAFTQCLFLAPAGEDICMEPADFNVVH